MAHFNPKPLNLFALRKGVQGQRYPTREFPMEALGDDHAQEGVVRARRVCVGLQVSPDP